MYDICKETVHLHQVLTGLMRPSTWQAHVQLTPEYMPTTPSEGLASCLCKRSLAGTNIPHASAPSANSYAVHCIQLAAKQLHWAPCRVLLQLGLDVLMQDII